MPPPRSVTLESDRTYLAALGEFIETFATIETVIFNALISYANMPVPVGRALLSGTRVDQAIDFINRLFEAGLVPQNERAEIADALTQLRAINNFRNTLVHHNSFVTSDRGRVVSNVSRALTPARIREHRTSPEILAGAIHDLIKIGNALLAVRFMRGVPPLARAKELPILSDAWRYKPDELSTHEGAGKDRNRGRRRE